MQKCSLIQSNLPTLQMGKVKPRTQTGQERTGHGPELQEAWAIGWGRLHSPTQHWEGMPPDAQEQGGNDFRVSQIQRKLSWCLCIDPFALL